MLLVDAAAGVLYTSPSALFSSLQWLERQIAGLSHQRIEAADLSTHYYRGGPADGETILMIHGFAANKDNWLRLARHFTERYQVIAVDLPGFGDSSKPQANYDVGTKVERIAAFTQALNIAKLHLIGNSMGGHIAALYAARYPQRVLSLALLDNAGVSAPQKSELIERLSAVRPTRCWCRGPADFERLLDFVFVEAPALPATLKGYLAEKAVDNSAHYQRFLDKRK